MTDYRSMYDRDYIDHFDLPGGKDITLTIKKVVGGELTAMGGRKSKKPIVHFTGNVKPLICNKTNAKTIAAMYGNNVEDWAGRRITLYVSTTRDPSGGGEVECIRIRPKVPSGAAPQPEMDDDAGADADDTPRITPDQALTLETRCTENGVPLDSFKRAANVERISQIAAADYERADKWITAAIKKRQDAAALATQA